MATVLRQRSPRGLPAHSLGSVDLFVPKGSPPAMNSVVFDGLSFPAQGRGAKPHGAGTWVDNADRGDPVAAPRKALSQRFTGAAQDDETGIHLVTPHRSARSHTQNSTLPGLAWRLSGAGRGASGR
ncbi:hypothetical protein ABZ490_40670 [Streptomyces sp. NPDC005811]|uniref:hypothetical protein n=1 Tax=Streptomyces sp. NPDC005811 TaxID=3154565 RepID=UPI0033DB9508